MEFSPVEIVNLIDNRSPRGSFSVFVKMNETIGVKLTRSMSVRDGNYSRQTEAAKHGLGPDTYGKIDGIVYKDETYYGYFTEVVDVVSECASPGYYRCNEDVLVRELKNKIGFNFSDCKPNNCGIKNGEMICIDFDDTGYNFQYMDETFLYLDD